jgi:hypothetical protein
VEALRRFVSFVEAGIGADESSVDPFGSKPVMSEGLTERLDEQRREAVECVEFPRAQRFASRPSLTHIFAGVTSRADRNVGVVQAIRDHGYSMREVAQFLGRHYATISRVLAHAAGHGQTAGAREMS